ncbi:hypothetical protein [Streptomyces hesseae]|uniref:Uncharacterized protein n=1 Tax=Streptomyces hesseae TaxID=3075519 RepID=A0ABU2SUP7_9ACTN|nr:hypothetical protein [Streptomyces sp. DSM 40473]MDT0452732.1 hypothetical protein [Streptomyces sp. DSM 40473]
MKIDHPIPIGRSQSQPVGGHPVSPDFLHYRGTAVQALDELSQAQTLGQLLDRAHMMWCGPACEQTMACTFLHYPRVAPPPGTPRAQRSRYNKETADLFPLMGGDEYDPSSVKVHEVDFWPLLRAVAGQVGAGKGLPVDYSDWSKKGDATAAASVRYACRDAIQYMANWSGERYADSPVAVHYTAFAVIVDELCIPPLDLVQGRFRMYGRSAADLAQVMDEQGWGSDGPQVMLALIRQFMLQYAEKVEHASDPGRTRLKAHLNKTPNMWDALIYRTHTANCYGVAIAVGRVLGSGPSSFTWLWDSSICNATSMDLCKHPIEIYGYDYQNATASPRFFHQRRTAYRSIYLDLIDDLVASGAPEALVHYGRSGFLFVQTQERYHERRASRRMPLTPAITTHLHDLFGDTPADSSLERRFHPYKAG